MPDFIRLTLASDNIPSLINVDTIEGVTEIGGKTYIGNAVTGQIEVTETFAEVEELLRRFIV